MSGDFENSPYFKDANVREPPSNVPFVGKMLLITYYGYKDPIGHAVDQLTAHGWCVINFSLFRWKHDQHDKQKRYLDFLIELATHYEPDAFLFWYFGLEVTEMQTLRQAINRAYDPYSPFILYNWNDPYTWVSGQSAAPFAELCRYFDAVATCCGDMTNQYKSNLHQFRRSKEVLNDQAAPRLSLIELTNTGESVQQKEEETKAPSATSTLQPLNLVCMQVPGYNAQLAQKYIDIYKEKHATRFQCDVSIACTNLYDSPEIFPRQKINRRALIDAIYADKSIRFHIYGPERFASMYPDAYRGELPYEQTYQLSQTSHICINTHVVSADISHYCNERTSVIMGTGGLLLTDIPISLGMDMEPSVQDAAQRSAIVMEESVEKVVAQIKKILNEWSEVRRDEIRANALQFAQNYFTWHVWAKRVHDLARDAIAVADESYDTELAQSKRSQRNKKGLIVAPVESEKNVPDTDALDVTKLTLDLLNPTNAQHPYVPKSDFMQCPGAVSAQTMFKLQNAFVNIYESSGKADSQPLCQAWDSLQTMIFQNPTIDVNMLLQNYWHQEDQFH